MVACLTAILPLGGLGARIFRECRAFFRIRARRQRSHLSAVVRKDGGFRQVQRWVCAVDNYTRSDKRVADHGRRRRLRLGSEIEAGDRPDNEPRSTQKKCQLEPRLTAIGYLGMACFLSAETK